MSVLATDISILLLVNLPKPLARATGTREGRTMEDPSVENGLIKIKIAASIIRRLPLWGLIGTLPRNEVVWC
jgi:hypothetical protein